MHDRKTYLKLFWPLFLFIVYLSVRLFGQIISEQRQEQELYLLNAELPTGEITKELMAEMQKFPGLCRMWTMMSADVEISAEGCTAGGKLFGVDLETYPLKLLKSGGQKAMGTKPLLLVGEDFLKGMTDSNGFSITARQEELLIENIGSLKAEVRLSANTGSAGELYLPNPAGITGKNLGEEALQADHLQNEAEFLGVVMGDGLYMDASQMKLWLSFAGIQPGNPCICLEIRGRPHVMSAKKSLENAGFITVRTLRCKQ